MLRSVAGLPKTPLRIKWRALLDSRITRNLGTVMLGTLSAQVITICFVPVISRLFSPADLGIVGSFVAVVGICGTAATLQYSQALMLPKSETDAAAVFVLACVLAATSATVCALVTFAIPGVARFGGTDAIMIAWLLPVSVLLNGINQTVRSWCTRQKAFTATSQSQIFRAVATGGGQTFAGTIGSGGFGLVLGYVIGDAVGCVRLCCALSRNDFKRFRENLQLSKLLQAARSYRDFPAYATPQNLLNAASQGLPVFLLAYFFGNSVAGFYMAGAQILLAPMTVILTAVRQVLFQHLTEAQNNGEVLFPRFARYTAALFGVSIVPAMCAFAFAPQVAGIVLGPGWSEAGVYARWLVIWLLVLFCNVPSVLLARILRLQKKMLLLDVLLLFSRLLALILGGWMYGPKTTIIVFSCVGAAFNMFIIGWVGRVAYRFDRRNPTL